MDFSCLGDPARDTHSHSADPACPYRRVDKVVQGRPQGHERAQAGLQRKFYDQTDPQLPEAERQRRAVAAYRAHMSRIAFQRSKAKAAQAVES